MPQAHTLREEPAAQPLVPPVSPLTPPPPTTSAGPLLHLTRSPAHATSVFVTAGRWATQCHRPCQTPHPGWVPYPAVTPADRTTHPHCRTTTWPREKQHHGTWARFLMLKFGCNSHQEPPHSAGDDNAWWGIEGIRIDEDSVSIRTGPPRLLPRLSICALNIDEVGRKGKRRTMLHRKHVSHFF